MIIAAGAASATRSSDANSNALIASVSKLNGRNINVRGNSLRTSINTSNAALIIDPVSRGIFILLNVFMFDTPNERDASSSYVDIFSKPLSMLL